MFTCVEKQAWKKTKRSSVIWATYVAGLKLELRVYTLIAVQFVYCTHSYTHRQTHKSRAAIEIIEANE